MAAKGDTGVDYSAAPPGGAAIAAAGYRFAARYLSNSPSKNIDEAEAADLRSNGIDVVVVWETTAMRALDGQAAGSQDAAAAREQADALGFPADAPIYFAVDFDASEAQQAPIDAYLSAAGSVLGADLVGVYGGFYVVERCFENGTATFGWQTGAWSGGQVSDQAHIYQRIGQVTVGGTECDVDEALQDNFGQWPADGSTPPPNDGGGDNGGGATPPPSGGGGDGQLTVDGQFGPATIRALQTAVGAQVDGQAGPDTWRHVQQTLGVPVDGQPGAQTIRALQARVGAAIDGNFGSGTTAQLQQALNAGVFPAEYFITVDGGLGRQTIAALQAATGATIDGHAGADTWRHVQRYLNITADGELGPQTIRALQQHTGATVDGQAGPSTWRHVQQALRDGTF